MSVTDTEDARIPSYNAENDLDELIRKYEEAKSEATKAYKVMATAAPGLCSLWESVEAVRQFVFAKIKRREEVESSLVRIALCGPEIVREALVNNEKVWRT